MKAYLTGTTEANFISLILSLLTFLTLFVIYVPQSNADRTSSAGAAQAVRVWLKINPKPLDTSLGEEVANVQTFTDGREQPLYYVVYLRPNGFVILPADDMVEPIIAFVEKGTYTPSDEHPLGALVTSDVPARIFAMRQLQQAERQGRETGFQAAQAKAREIIGE